MKTAIIIGRFQPISTAHKEIIQDAIKKYDQTYIVVINSFKSIAAGSRRRMRAQGFDTPKEDDVSSWKRLAQKDDEYSKKYGSEYSRKLPKGLLSKKGEITPKNIENLEKEKNKNPFSGMMRKKLIHKSFDGKLHHSKIISHQSANIEQIVNKIYRMNNENNDFVLLCGEDRRTSYRAQINSAFDKGFFDPEIKSVELSVIDRDIDSIDNISATKIRDAIRSNDFKEFKKLTPSGIHDEFEKLQKVVMQEMKNIPFFKKMLVEMVHIEDLSVSEFINFVRNIYQTEASVKLDGTAALSFGLDENGSFYTGFGRDFKEVKPQYRKYSVEDWLRDRHIFVNPAVSAHTFLEKHIETIKKHIKPGEKVLAEVLFGDKPNCIKYDFSGTNYLVIINNEDLADELDGKKSDVDTVNYVLETESVVPKAVKQTWRFGKTQRVDPSKYEIDIDEELSHLEEFLNSKTEGERNIDIIGMRAAGKKKYLVKKVRKQAEDMKLNIKEKLLRQFVRQVREGEYIPSEGYSHEGIVLKLGDERVKIIDKEVFTALHDRDWEPAHAAQKIRKSMSKEDAIKELTKMIDNFDELYPNVSDDMKMRMKNTLRMTRLTLKEKP